MNEIKFRGSTTINFALISGIGMTLSLEVEGGIKKFYFQRGCQKNRKFFETIAVRSRPPPPTHPIGTFPKTFCTLFFSSFAIEF